MTSGDGLPCPPWSTSTKALRLFQGQLIPGLLQTPEYATAVFSLPPALPDETKARTVAARLERQAALYEDGRSFHFVICEHVLRWLICESTVMAVQLDRLVSLSRLPAVSIGVVPQAGRKPDFPMTCFSIHDDSLVIVETFHSEVTTRDPRDVQTYVDTFDRFAAVALYGDDMRGLVESLDGRLGHRRERAGPTAPCLSALGGEPLMTIKARYRFRDYKVTSVTADQTAEPSYEAECVTGDDADCGAASGVLFTSDDVTRWMVCHTRDTPASAAPARTTPWWSRATDPK
ncbi:DUF5753 domain-containing protein [Streptomyces kebangsaanensis]|uniref:DUF5753 domain-containing protein n=1 Tax=Streptomyces kebangsaanensis TaxID=864058 RepID=A0ABW6KNI1_9ACTN